MIPRISLEQTGLESTLRLILKNAVKALDGSAGVVATWDEAEHRFVASASCGLDSRTLDQLQPLLDETAPDLSGSRISFNLLSELRPDLELPVSGDGVRQNPIIALRLKVGEQSVGLIYILRPLGSHAFSRIDQPILAAFAEQAAMAVHNARLAHLLAEEKQRIEAILENSADGIMSIDSRCRILGFNAAMEKLTGYPRSEALNKECFRILNFTSRDQKNLCNVQCPMVHALAENRVVCEQEGVIRAKDGHPVDVTLVYSIVRSPEGKPINAVVNVHDNSRIREVENLREAILSMLGHEIQTPLAIIKGYTDTLSRTEGRWDPETLKQGLQVIEEESDRLSRVMKKLLLASRLSSGALKLEKEAVHLPSLVQKVVRRLNSLTDRHTFAFDFEADFPAVPAEPQLLEQVLANLVENAIKYSPEGGKVTVTGKRVDYGIRVAVIDEGPGIPPGEAEHLFERFYRLEKGLSRKIPGTGLGLYICKSIIEAHGGKMEVSSLPGRGSEFAFILPVEEKEQNA